MFLDDIYQEEKLNQEMTKAHKERKKQEYCKKCNRWYSRFVAHRCEKEEVRG